MTKRNERRRELGKCRTDGIMATLLTDLVIGDATGQPTKWAHYRKLYPKVGGVRLETLLALKWLEVGSITLLPLTHTMPMTSGEAHLFRELALCLVANYPELICRHTGANWLSVTHKAEDPHHVFEVIDADERQVRHQWGAESSVLSL
jgi:hypothetical protein